MSQSTSRKRPWLAALLAAIVTGLGHLYLRRWRRALGWLVVLFGVTALLVDPATLEALAAGDAVDPVAVAPVLVVGGFSILDAYVLARAHNSESRASDAPGGETPSAEMQEDERPECPHCGHEVDPELDFCHWCTSELDGREFRATEDGRDAP